MRDWLATARKTKNFTHQEVADKAGIKRQYYGMIESGDRTPSVTIAKNISSVLDVDWTLFFENQSNKMLLNEKEVS
ncbi:MAG TPA: XRE family transcriptional regulator [Bacillus bacterium]|uniref:helix-turn-helix transcriptional regulator n=1 Tax=Siminovitchia fordii TaxID=254759 RepID=UPI00037A68EA|nr:helix-turn-helix transcriptional regulator [Siminovitchia fordii]HBZ09157.1 XRE family transcriptional regulator [Bacillus sp. (in: firmicutes)]